jgi:thymidine kinase
MNANIQIQHTPYLELIIGPMFSGKTSHLIYLSKLYKIANKSVCVINYHEDKRYSETKLSNHDNVSVECIFTETLESLDIQKISSTYDVILINEGQFFKDLYETTIAFVEKHNKIVYISGLDGTFKREPFKNNAILQLIPLCDNVVKKHAICKRCRDGTNAIFSHRITDNKDEKIIGGYDQYLPVCRKCYLELNIKSNQL